MSKGRYDWDVHELLKEWDRKCRPDNMRVGQCVRHGRNKWLIFGAFEGDDLIIAMDGDEPVVVPTNECFRGWDPDIDPIRFEEALQKRRKEKRART